MLICIYLLHNRYYSLTSQMFRSCTYHLPTYHISICGKSYWAYFCCPLLICEFSSDCGNYFISTFHLLLFEICPVTLVPYADVIHTSFAKLSLHSIAVRLSTIHSVKYFFNSKEYSVCKCTSVIIYW